MHVQRNQPETNPQRVGCAAQACLFEFKTFRLHRGLAVQITVIYIEPSYWLKVGCCISSVLSYVKTCVDLFFPPFVSLCVR